jgi:hypothetical protein
MLGQVEKTDAPDIGQTGRRRPSLSLVVALVAVLLAGGGAAMVASGLPGSSQPASQPGVSLTALNRVLGAPRTGLYPRAGCRLRPRCRRRLATLRLLRQGLHGQITYQTAQGFRTLAFERGLVGSVSGGAVSVTAADHTTWTWHLTGRTAVRQDGRRVSRASLASGERILVVGPVSGGTDEARLIVIGAAGSAR